MKQSVFIVLILANVVLGLYDGRSKVQLLTKKDFKERVLNSKGLWMIEFFAPWCGHCKSLAPEYEKVAKTLEGIVNVGAVDMDANAEVGSPYGIQGFPTLKFFGDNKNTPADYSGERTAEAMIDYLLDQTKRAVKDRQSGGKSQRDRSSKSSSSSSSSGASDRDVVVLEDGTFEENVFKSKDSWFVEFYAPWCGHCKKLEPEWNKVASDLKGEVKVAKVDATVQTKLAQRFGVSGYPTIKFFPAGFTSDSEVVDYGGARDASSLTSWAQEQASKFKKLEITQLTNQAEYEEKCQQFNGLCVILFLPHIYDSNKRERNDYLKIFEEGASSGKSKPFVFLWAQGGDHYDFEEAFQSGSAYPSVLALSNKKSVYAKLKGVFNKASFETFLKNLLSGRESFVPYQSVPKLNTVKAWDGQDHKLQQQDHDDF